MDVELVAIAYDDPVVVDLVDEFQQEMADRYGDADGTPVDPSEFADPTGTFVVALRDDVPVGCFGLRRHDDETAELKRMFVRRSHRRRGLARLLLATAERRARELGYSRLALETGLPQPEAVALYSSAGYARITDFGYHRDHALQRAFAIDLRERDAGN